MHAESEARTFRALIKLLAFFLSSPTISTTSQPERDMSTAPKFWLRCEKKPFERRAALTPTTAKQLIDAGFEITVERDDQRIFDDAEYEAYVLEHTIANDTLSIVQCRV